MSIFNSSNILKNEIETYTKNFIDNINELSEKHFIDSEFPNDQYKKKLANNLNNFLNNIHVLSSHQYFHLISHVSNIDFDDNIINNNNTDNNMDEFDSMDNISNFHELNESSFNSNTQTTLDSFLSSRDGTCDSSIYNDENNQDSDNDDENNQDSDDGDDGENNQDSSDDEINDNIKLVKLTDIYEQNIVDNINCSQCCARIGSKLYNINEQESEFMDNYPSETYIDSNGIVYGNPCSKMINDNDFNEGNIFCDVHKNLNIYLNDIRKPPSKIHNNKKKKKNYKKSKSNKNNSNNDNSNNGNKLNKMDLEEVHIDNTVYYHDINTGTIYDKKTFENLSQ